MIHNCVHKDVRRTDLPKSGSSESFGVSSRTIEDEYIPQLRRECGSWVLEHLLQHPGEKTVEGGDPCRRDRDGRVIYRFGSPVDQPDTEVQPSRTNPPDDARFVVALVTALDRSLSYWFVFRVCTDTLKGTHFCVAVVNKCEDEHEWHIKMSLAADRGAATGCPDDGCCLCHAQDESIEAISSGET